MRKAILLVSILISFAAIAQKPTAVTHGTPVTVQVQSPSFERKGDTLVVKNFDTDSSIVIKVGDRVFDLKPAAPVPVFRFYFTAQAVQLLFDIIRRSDYSFKDVENVMGSLQDQLNTQLNAAKKK